MSDLVALENNEIENWLSEFPRWRFENDQLIGDFKFKNFIEAFGFLTQVAILAEKQIHHPHIENVYNNVTLTLTTHDAGNKITEKDLKLAKLVERYAGD